MNLKYYNYNYHHHMKCFKSPSPPLSTTKPSQLLPYPNPSLYYMTTIASSPSLPPPPSPPPSPTTLEHQPIRLQYLPHQSSPPSPSPLHTTLLPLMLFLLLILVSIHPLLLLIPLLPFSSSSSSYSPSFVISDVGGSQRSHVNTVAAGFVLGQK
ncbi:hypothetical protein E2C01_072421 [Portunus trituberculatus]|uniref:Uncharacterized protein n=1 Tax=Portunus trituberculatus TaxID=210409 RepID=A0A5B7I2L1_PORTR|nr:hypothetical protein [Portunus trituberculatus]